MDPDLREKLEKQAVELNKKEASAKLDLRKNENELVARLDDYAAHLFLQGADDNAKLVRQAANVIRSYGSR